MVLDLTNALILLDSFDDFIFIVWVSVSVTFCVYNWIVSTGHYCKS